MRYPTSPTWGLRQIFCCFFREQRAFKGAVSLALPSSPTDVGDEGTCKSAVRNLSFERALAVTNQKLIFTMI